MTDAQKARIRFYLGYADYTRQFYSRLEGAISQLSVEAVEDVLELLNCLEEIQGLLRSSWTRLKASRVEDVTLAGPDEVRGLRSEGRRLVQSLSVTLGVAIQADVFSGGGQAGIAHRG